MAIAFNSVLSQTFVTWSSNPQTFAFTNTAGTGILLQVTRRDTGDTVTGATYAGVAMTLVNKIAIPSPSTSWLYMFHLENPATGTNNFSVTSTSTVSDGGVCAVSYAGGNVTSSFVNSSATNSATSAAISGTVTPSVAGCWSVMCAYTDNGGIAASTGSTARTTTGSATAMFDSNGTIANGSPNTMNATGTSAVWASIIVAIAPAAVAATTHSLLMMGVGS